MRMVRPAKKRSRFDEYHACRRHARCHHPCGNLGILPASEAARKRLHASEAKATSVKPAFVSIRGPVLHRRRWHRRLLRPRRERPCHRAAECGQQFPPSDGDCHAPLPREVRKETIPRHERAVFSFRGCQRSVTDVTGSPIIDPHHDHTAGPPADHSRRAVTWVRGWFVRGVSHRAAEALSSRGIGLAELLEQLRLLLRGQADAGVGDGKLDEAAAIAHLACRKLDLARSGELAGIAEEIEQESTVNAPRSSWASTTRNPRRLVLDRKKLAAFLALGGGFLLFPIGDRCGT